MDFGKEKSTRNALDALHNKNISFSYFAIAKHSRNFNVDSTIE